MTIVERGLVFPCAGEHLAGVVSLPDAGLQPDLGVVVLVGGPQYRAGSHRQFVLLGRALAGAGFPTLRFDVRGMGDSSGDARPFERLDDDIAAAVDALQAAVPSVRQVVLWGLCDGASAALLYLQRRADRRVSGLCLLNPWVRTAAGEARTRLKHYYLRRVLEPSFWAKLLRGGLGLRAVRGLVGHVAQARGAPAGPSDGGDRPYTALMSEAFARFGGDVLLLLSGNDYTAKEFLDFTGGSPQWKAALARPAVQRHDLPRADHTFSDDADRREVERLTTQWLQALSDAPTCRGGRSQTRLEPEPT